MPMAARLAFYALRGKTLSLLVRRRNTTLVPSWRVTTIKKTRREKSGKREAMNELMERQTRARQTALEAKGG